MWSTQTKDGISIRFFNSVLFKILSEYEFHSYNVFSRKWEKLPLEFNIKHSCMGRANRLYYLCSGSNLPKKTQVPHYFVGLMYDMVFSSYNYIFVVSETQKNNKGRLSEMTGFCSNFDFDENVSHSIIAGKNVFFYSKKKYHKEVKKISIS